MQSSSVLCLTEMGLLFQVSACGLLPGRHVQWRKMNKILQLLCTAGLLNFCYGSSKLSLNGADWSLSQEAGNITGN
jgi:hypothetical protein